MPFPILSIPSSWNGTGSATSKCVKLQVCNMSAVTYKSREVAVKESHTHRTKITHKHTHTYTHKHTHKQKKEIHNMKQTVCIISQFLIPSHTCMLCIRRAKYMQISTQIAHPTLQRPPTPPPHSCKEGQIPSYWQPLHPLPPSSSPVSLSKAVGQKTWAYHTKVSTTFPIGGHQLLSKEHCG